MTDVIHIALTKGYSATIDADDAERVLSHRWYANETGYGVYAAAYIRPAPDARASRVYLHRFLVGARKGMTVDHVNRDTLDNRRANLRFATPLRQTLNRVTPTGNAGFKGVYFDKRRGNFRASIKFEYRARHIGVFDTAEAAARAYDAEAVRLFGADALLNFPPHLVPPPTGCLHRRAICT
ncbi:MULTISPECIES: HNH endonuclease [Hyphobacterium]|uniref:HNH endonuclease n=1 Tax=Hyphobacterium vulgare TaxID=1736751 RepID=A0ABV6ZU91_9PROT